MIEEKRMVPLKFDLMFKKVFGDKDDQRPLRKLLECILDIKPKKITIDINDGMSIVTIHPNGKEIGVKYLDNKDDFEYIGKISDLKD